MGGRTIVYSTVGHNVDYDEKREERQKTLQAYEVI